MERRARLLNLDAPVKFAQTTPEGTQPTARDTQATGITEAEWAALLATHQAQHACQDDQATCT